jgi:hypothetical protein
VHSVLAVCFFKGTSTTKPDEQARMDGVSTYLALTFGTLLSSQGTEASFGPGPVSRTSPSGLSLRVSDLTRSDRRSYRFSFPAPCRSGVFRAFRRDHHVSGFPGRVIIGPVRGNSGMPKSSPRGSRAVVNAAVRQKWPPGVDQLHPAAAR